jgi:2-methylcitrate dehydratase PrpD
VLRALRDTQRPAGGDDVAREIMINCALVRLTEIDDIHLAAMITPGAIVIPATLSVAASLPGVNATAINEAIVCGYEAMVRLGIAIDGPTTLYRGIWPSYFAAGFGVTAATARLVNLTAEQTANALALALTLSPPGVGQHNAPTSSRWLAIGACARNGYLAALAAGAGVTSDIAILDGKFLSNVYGIAARTEALTSGLGGRFAIQETSFKPWCAARQTMASAQALRDLIAGGIDPAAITAVEAAIPPQFQRMIDHGVSAEDRLSRLTSLQYQLAVAALDLEAALDVGQTRAIPAAVHGFMDKVRVRADDELGKHYPATWPARLRVEAGGTVREQRVDHVPGDPARPFASADVRGKVHRFLDPSAGFQTADRLIAETESLIAGNVSPRRLLDTIESACAAAR